MAWFTIRNWRDPTQDLGRLIKRWHRTRALIADCTSVQGSASRSSYSSLHVHLVGCCVRPSFIRPPLTLPICHPLTFGLSATWRSSWRRWECYRHCRKSKLLPLMFQLMDVLCVGHWRQNARKGAQQCLLNEVGHLDSVNWERTSMMTTPTKTRLLDGKLHMKVN